MYLGKRRVGFRHGFATATGTTWTIGLFVLTGLATDIGRISVARTQLQALAEEAAFAASFELDGTRTGLSRARYAAARLEGARVEFATMLAGPFRAEPASASGYRFVRVEGSRTLRLRFLSIVPGLRPSRVVTAASIAGQAHESEIEDDSSHSLDDADSGFEPDEAYALPSPCGMRQIFTCRAEYVGPAGLGRAERDTADPGLYALEPVR